MACSDPGVYALFAVKYATHERTATANFIDPPDPHEVMPIDYFIWAAVSDERTFVIDMGFAAEAAADRGRTLIRCPTEALAAVGVTIGAEVRIVVIGAHETPLRLTGAEALFTVPADIEAVAEAAREEVVEDGAS